MAPDMKQMTGKVKEFEDLNTRVWGKALRLIEEGNVKCDYPADTHTVFKVIGDSDAHTVGMDMDSREAKCDCKDEFYKGSVCAHEVAAHFAMAILDYDGESELRDKILEDPDMFLREGKQ